MHMSGGARAYRKIRRISQDPGSDPTGKEPSAMVDFPRHDMDSAPEAARPWLEKAETEFGFIPNILRVQAEAPAALAGYMTLSGQFAESSFSAAEQQIVLLAISFVNRCDYCMAAHSMIARMNGVSEPVVAALRAGEPLPDSRLEALRHFAALMTTERGHVSQGELERFLAAAFTRAQALEVILAIAQKTLSNYTNHIAETPLDSALSDHAWRPPEREAAE